VDFRAGGFIWAVKADSVHKVFMIVLNCEHVGGNRLMALRSYAKEGHGVAVAAHGDVGGKFVQVITQGEMVEKEIINLACSRNT